MTTTFIRLLSAQDKAEALTSAVVALRDGRTEEGVVFTVDPSSFSKVPNSPFAYWVDDSIRDLFVKLPPFEGEGRTVKQGLATADDFRFVRAWWEVPASRRLDAMNGPDHRENLPAFQDWCRKRTGKGKYWVPFAKGGEYSPYYADIHLVVNWKQEGEEIRNFSNPASGKLFSRPQSTGYYFLPGLTWPERTTSGYAPQALPAGTIFSHKGQIITMKEIVLLPRLLAVHNTRVFQFLLEILVGLGDASVSGSAARDYTTGLVARLPFPGEMLEHNESTLDSSCRELIHWHSQANRVDETCASFSMAIAQTGASSVIVGNIVKNQLSDAISACSYVAKVELLVRQNLVLTKKAVNCITETIGPNACLDLQEGNNDCVAKAVSEIGSRNQEEMVDYLSKNMVTDRSSTKKAFFVSRVHEVLAQNCQVNLLSVLHQQLNAGVIPSGFEREVANRFLMWTFSLAFGRWDVRPLLNEKLVARLPDPFSPLPVCPPATLMGPDGFPATSGNIVSEEWLTARPDGATLPPAGSVKIPTIADDDYPIEVPWDGILVDDPDHPADIVIQMRKAMEVLWKGQADSVEQEACRALGVGDLRAYMRSPGGFFQDHLASYSKSRRKAPIYWPLSTPSGSYTLWLYYPRLTESTLYQCVNAFVKPKLDGVRAELSALRARMEDKPSAETRDHFDVVTSLERELEEMMRELLRVAALGYRPDLDDGVVICACPLRTLFRLPRWKDELDEIWEKLEMGDFDWAHMAMTLWPDRVKAACAGNRSFAIAHVQEALFVPAPAAASKPARSRKGKK